MRWLAACGALVWGAIAAVGQPCDGPCMEEVHFKGNLDAPEAVCAHVHVYGGSGEEPGLTADHLTSSLRANAKIIDTDTASTFELVTTKIKVVTGELYLQGVASVTGSIHYTTDVRLTVPDVDSAFLELGSATQRAAHSPPDVTHSGGWAQLASDEFSDAGDSEGWAYGAGAPAGRGNRTAALPAVQTASCQDGNPFMSSGNCSDSGTRVASKIFDRLPPHTQLHLSARFHFIDAWEGQTAFAQVDGRYVWLDAHVSPPSPVNLCGGPFGDSRLGAVVDVVLPHTADQAVVSFGAVGSAEASSEDACRYSWGVDDVHFQVK